MINLTLEESAYIRWLLEADIESLRDCLETSDAAETVDLQRQLQVSRTILSKVIK